MERTETMISPTEFFGEAIKALLFAAIGWLIANFSFQRKIDDFEKRIVAPIRADLSKLEGASTVFVTREELKAEMAGLRTDFKEAVAEVKQLIRDMRSDLK